MSTAQNSDYCGGCGETDGTKRCIGCMHPFSTAPTPSARTYKLAMDAANDIMTKFANISPAQIHAQVQVIVQQAIEAGRQPREALTDERIKEIHVELCGTVGSSYDTMARAIEAETNKMNGGAA